MTGAQFFIELKNLRLRWRLARLSSDQVAPIPIERLLEGKILRKYFHQLALGQASTGLHVSQEAWCFRDLAVTKNMAYTYKKA
jgi:hypothetical protein